MSPSPHSNDPYLYKQLAILLYVFVGCLLFLFHLRLHRHVDVDAKLLTGRENISWHTKPTSVNLPAIMRESPTFLALFKNNFLLEGEHFMTHQLLTGRRTFHDTPASYCKENISRFVRVCELIKPPLCWGPPHNIWTRICSILLSLKCVLQKTLDDCKLRQTPYSRFPQKSDNKIPWLFYCNLSCFPWCQEEHRRS